MRIPRGAEVVLALAVLAASTAAVTLGVQRNALNDARQRQRDDVERAAVAVSSTLGAELRTEEDVAAFLSDAPLSSRAWRIARARLFVDPALFGAGIALSFPDSERRAVERRLGRPLREPGANGTLRPALRRDRYVVPIYAAYRTPGTAGLGVNLAAEPRRRATFARAARRGRGQFTAPVRLVGSTQMIVVAYAPISTGGAVTGYVIASYRTAGLLSRVHAVLGRGVEFRLTDGDVAFAPTAMRAPVSKTVRIGGRSLHVAVGRPAVHDAATIAVGAGGATVTVLVALLLLQATRSESRAIASREALREAQADLRARTSDAEAANEQLESFAYSVSHDLRGPLRAIDGFSQIVLEEHGDELDADAREHLGRVRAATMRMSRIIDGLLALSRVSRRPLERAHVDLSAVAGEIVAELRDADGDREVDVDVAAGIVAEADPYFVETILGNLLANAFKFTGAKPQAHIRLAVESRDGVPVYVVSDDGAGFDMAHVDHLFRPFERLHDPSEYPGEGIGLATVARAVQRHGGVVWAESAPGEGATFRFTLSPGPGAGADVSD